jgi:carbamoyltransferase
MIEWGLVGNSHDASIAVFDNNILQWASLSKDFSGVPNDPHLSQSMVNYVLDQWGMPLKVTWYERPLLKTLRQWKAGQGWLWSENNISSYINKYVKHNVPIRYTQHHHSHAAYAYYTQPHDNCAVICLDSIGEFETLTMWHGQNGNLKKIHSQGYPHSLGLWYSSMTQRIGLVPQRDEYMISIMGKQGDPNILKNTLLEDLFAHYPTLKDPRVVFKENLHRGCKWWRLDLSSKEDLINIAAATQAIFEDILTWLSAWARFETGCSYLALAGGGALNKDAVDGIRNQWKHVHVPMNPGDPGSCIGAVLAHNKKSVEQVLDNIWYKKV